MEVVEIGDASGNAVGKLTGHAVFGDFGQAFADSVVQFTGDFGANRLGERSEAGDFASSCAYSGKKTRSAVR